MNTACGYIALIGAPNAGKSTLANAFAGGKVSIVSPRVQTTRFRVRAIAMEGAAQLVFVDTPGIFSARKAFEKNMVDEAWAAVAEADAVLLLIDAEKGIDDAAQGIVERLQSMKRRPPLAIALNKVDQVSKPFLLKLATVVNGFGIADVIFMISALKEDGVADIKRWLAGRMPQGAWLFPEDQTTDQSMRALAAELTREKLFYALRQELPYSLAVETESWEDAPGGVTRIRQAILVEREGQKKIVIGEGASVLKRVGTQTRKELEAMLGRKVHLELFVKVEREWKRKFPLGVIS